MHIPINFSCPVKTAKDQSSYPPRLSESRERVLIMYKDLDVSQQQRAEQSWTITRIPPLTQQWQFLTYLT